jgi:hypothetical protein
VAGDPRNLLQLPGWLGDLLDHWGTVLAAITLLLICFKALSFISSLVAWCLSAHHIWGCQLHLLAAVLPSVLQWMAIQLGLRGVWPAIEGDDTADQEVESFLTHARRSVMMDQISKKDHRKRDNYCESGSLAELGALGVGRKEPTGCDSIIEMHKAKSFRIPVSFKVIPMGSLHSPAVTIVSNSPKSIVRTKSPPSASRYVIPCMWRAISRNRIFGQVAPFRAERIFPVGWPLAVEDWIILCIRTSDKNSRWKRFRTRPGGPSRRSPAAT